MGREREIAKRERDRVVGKLYERNHRYYQTEKGRSTAARASAKRRYSQDPEMWATWFARLIVQEKRPCGWCKHRAETLDHVEPLALGALFGHTDLDQPWNFQPLCFCCHKAKTKLDRSDIARVKRELRAA